MKKFLLFVALALLVSTADAQLKNMASQSRGAAVKEKMSKRAARPQANKLDLSKITLMQEMQASDFTVKDFKTSKTLAPAKSGELTPLYRRPAGMYVSSFFALDGMGGFNLTGNTVFLMAKPYAEYTWEGYAPEANSNTCFAWDFWMNGEKHYLDYQSKLAFSTEFSFDTIPVFYAANDYLNGDSEDWYSYQIKSCVFNYSTQELLSKSPAMVLSADNNTSAGNLAGIDDSDTFEPLYSSKTMLAGGRDGDYNNRYIFTYYTGLDPYGDNDYGWWFGKNGGTSRGNRINGIAQAFEKPQHPYALTNVYLYTALIEATSDVSMTCKVYKLDEIPEYLEDDPVILPEVPGELIATGEAIVTPDAEYENGGLLTFTLFEEDDSGLSIVSKPVIDFPILVCIDGYNDAEMEALVDFSAMISTDIYVDEGYGELAYLKFGGVDDEGNFTGEYDWRGINNFFSTGLMKTGFSIFIGTENNFITFDNENDNGEYLFPNTGGFLKKTWADGSTTDGIKFLSSKPNYNGEWKITCNGTENLPDWLYIELTDQSVEEEAPYFVTANVMAQALPSGVNYREAIVRFEVLPGDGYVDYKFMQGTKPVILRGDVDESGRVDISDVSTLIDLLLSRTPGGPGADVDGNGIMNISDVSALIDLLLSGDDPVPVTDENESGNRTFTVNGVSFNMIAVEGGTFAMGATRDQGGNPRSYEKPVHLVTLSDYCIGQTEVTQALWVAVMGSNPSSFSGDLNRPVEMVSWNKCQEFITRLNQLTGQNFRMPTEAEWEFAARGGNKSRGNMFAGNNSLDEVGWYSGNSANTTHPVANKKPNELGIYDMSGNVFEWCSDYNQGENYGSADHLFDPTGPDSGDTHIIRGGAFDYGDEYSPNARRWYDSPTSVWNDQGLRLAL